MNILSTLCALILGITIGIAFNHNRELDHTLKSNISESQAQPINIYTSPANYITPNSDQPTSFTSVTQPPAAKQVSLNTPPPPSADLTNLINQQKAILRQLAEQSKEIQTLTFRQDSFSDKFIPLRKDSNSTGSASSPASGLTPLLPPIQ